MSTYFRSRLWAAFLCLGLSFFCGSLKAHDLFRGLFNSPECIDELALITADNFEKYQASALTHSEDAREQAEYVRRRVRVRYLLNELDRSVQEWTYSEAILSHLDQMVTTTGLPAYLLNANAYDFFIEARQWFPEMEKRAIEIVPILMETFILGGVPTRWSQIDLLRKILVAKVAMAGYRAAISREYLNEDLSHELPANFERLGALMLIGASTSQWVKKVLRQYPKELSVAVSECQDGFLADYAPPELVEAVMASAIPVPLKKEISKQLDWQKKTRLREPYFHPFLRAIRDYFGIKA